MLIIDDGRYDIISYNIGPVDVVHFVTKELRLFGGCITLIK